MRPDSSKESRSASIAASTASRLCVVAKTALRGVPPRGRANETRAERILVDRSLDLVDQQHAMLDGKQVQGERQDPRTPSPKALSGVNPVLRCCT